MKKWLFLLSLFFSSSFLCAAPVKNFDYDFQQDRMLVANDGIYLVSSLESKDALSAYSHHGDKLWEIFFHAKIVSWQVVGNRVFVFSKSRSGPTTYINCLDRYTGRILWERP